MNRLAVVVPYRFVPPVNGGHKAAFGLCAFLAKEVELSVLSTQSNDEKNAPFPLFPLFEDGFLKYINPLNAWRCYRFFKKNKIEACLTHQHFIAIILFPVACLLKIPLYIYAQNLEYQRFRSMGKSWWPLVFLTEWIAYKLANHIFFISPDELMPAQTHFNLPKSKCSALPYGTWYLASPKHSLETRQRVRQRHGYSENELIIIFFGPQSYQPNLEAVEKIITEINPCLAKQMGERPYRFIICGGGLPARYEQLAGYKQVDYLGFVENIDDYVLAADLMLNPIRSGGGVKTKLIEAIALGKTVISSYTGALGVDATLCGEKLVLVPDHDTEAYAQALMKAAEKKSSPTPTSFYAFYYWGNTIKTITAVMRGK
ncbi:MAG TPA: glycosyltransferase family 4 protein [Saprospiraceae bacterium]|nr:glycosyltransferase family 4 protein [Saprospiraceae bacterium]HMQ85362.1 glycosyltransferase family 4 protein [Saprospiraceae bacterium]